MFEYSRYAVPLALCAVILAGCTTSAHETAGPRIIQPGASDEPNRELTPEELAVIEAPEHAEIDVRFMQVTIAHHEPALRMIALVAERTQRETSPFAERMDISQTDEIELMQRWLEAREADLAGADGHVTDHDDQPKYGMLTEQELRQLKASGPEFDGLFLEFMVRHHRCAPRWSRSSTWRLPVPSPRSISSPPTSRATRTSNSAG